MTRRVFSIAATLGLLAGAWVLSHPGKIAQASPKRGENITMLDDCLPGDPGWTPTGGCTLKPNQGDVSFAEFFALATTPLGPDLIGHPSWRDDPSYVSMESGDELEVSNRGGRTHTFTEVVNFGGGVVPPLNGTLNMAPECANATNIAPGGETRINSLQPGLHKFQCCFHPWMRAAVRVK
jgi:plastocyanin